MGPSVYAYLLTMSVDLDLDETPILCLLHVQRSSEVQQHRYRVDEFLLNFRLRPPDEERGV